VKLENGWRITNSRPPPWTLVSIIHNTSYNTYYYNARRRRWLIFTRIKYNVIARFVKNRNSNILSNPILLPFPAAREQMVDCNGWHLIYIILCETHKRPIHTARTTGWLYRKADVHDDSVGRPRRKSHELV